MYTPRSFLILIVALYPLFLLGIDWFFQPGGAWYRPHLAALAAVAVFTLIIIRQGNFPEQFVRA